MRTKRNYSISLDDRSILLLRRLAEDLGWTKSAVLTALIGQGSVDGLRSTNQRSNG